MVISVYSSLPALAIWTYVCLPFVVLTFAVELLSPLKLKDFKKCKGQTILEET